MKKQIYTIAACCIIGLAIMFSNVQQVQAQTMTLAPHLIVLNSGGPDIDAHYGGPLVGSIVDFDVKLYFDGVEVADAYAFTYCYVDHIFKGEFDRQSISFNSQGTFVATMSGSYTTLDANGNNNTIYLNKWDWVEIKLPGKKGR